MFSLFFPSNISLDGVLSSIDQLDKIDSIDQPNNVDMSDTGKKLTLHDLDEFSLFSSFCWLVSFRNVFIYFYQFFKIFPCIYLTSLV